MPKQSTSRRATRPDATMTDVQRSYDSLPARIDAAKRVGNKAEVLRLLQVQQAVGAFIAERAKPQPAAGPKTAPGQHRAVTTALAARQRLATIERMTAHVTGRASAKPH